MNDYVVYGAVLSQGSRHIISDTDHWLRDDRTSEMHYVSIMSATGLV
jgi:hypothetical protein